MTFLADEFGFELERERCGCYRGACSCKLGTCGHYDYFSRGSISVCNICGHRWNEFSIQISDDDYQQALALMAGEKDRTRARRRK